MIYYDYYVEVPLRILDDFVRDCERGRLVAVSAEGNPHIGSYPCVHDGTLEARRSIVSALRARGRPADERAADAVQWTIDQQAGKPAP